jgi:UDP-N-acetylmuramate--alanine ligase
VTNIDADHMQTYGGDFQRLRKAFLEFLQRLPFYGLAVLCIDDPALRELALSVPRPLLTYGTEPGADLYAAEIRQMRDRTHFRIMRAGSDQGLEVVLSLPGRHNVLNALAAVAVGRELGVGDEDIRGALAGFQGIGRRFQVYGAVRTQAGEVLLIDDYGHHPREVAATLQAVRDGWPERRVVVAFQPHRYTRTHDLFEDFTQVLSEVDVLLLLEVYPAGEAPIAGADGRTLCGAIRARGQVNPVFVPGIAELPGALAGLLADGDVLLTLGAGDIGKAAAGLPDALAARPGAAQEAWS